MFLTEHLRRTASNVFKVAEAVLWLMFKILKYWYTLWPHYLKTGKICITSNKKIIIKFYWKFEESSLPWRLFSEYFHFGVFVSCSASLSQDLVRKVQTVYYLSMIIKRIQVKSISNISHYLHNKIVKKEKFLDKLLHMSEFLKKRSIVERLS